VAAAFISAAGGEAKKEHLLAPFSPRGKSGAATMISE
jgi:hypothetical protein